MLNGEGTDDKDINMQMQRNNLHLNCLQKWLKSNLTVKTINDKLRSVIYCKTVL